MASVGGMSAAVDEGCTIGAVEVSFSVGRTFTVLVLSGLRSMPISNVPQPVRKSTAKNVRNLQIFIIASS
jgi:hypothetical protein